MAKRKALDETQTAEVIAEQDVPFTEVPDTAEDFPVEQHAALELVTDPGMKKTIVFHGDVAAPDETVGDEAPVEFSESPLPPMRGPSSDLGDVHAGVDSLGPDPNFSGRPRRANLGPIPGRSRTVFRTESGGEVRAYESDRGRMLAVSTPTGEVPFRSEMVDDAIGRDEPLPEAAPDVIETTTTTTTTQTTEERPRRRFGFFGRKLPKPEFHSDGKGDPDVKHVYQPAVAVDNLPTEATAPTGAWDPGQQGTVVFQEHAPPATETAPHITVRSETWTSRTTRPARRQPKTKKVPVRKAAKPRKAAPRKPKSMMAYPGDNHPIIDIEGIGPKYAKRLEKAGITTTGLLSVTKPGKVAKAAQAPAKTVKGWQAQADLLKVKGVGPQYAEAMARAGIKGIEDLKKRPADKMSKQVTKYLDSLDVNVVGQPVTAKRMAAWKRKAAKMHKVKVNRDKLATPDHGIPPPWLRQKAKGKAAKKSAGKKR